MVIDEQFARNNNWKSSLARELEFDQELETMKLEMLRRALKVRDEAMAHFENIATKFSISRFLIDGHFWMTKAKALGYTFVTVAESRDLVNETTGQVDTVPGMMTQCVETTEVFWMNGLTGKSEMVEYFRK